MGSPPRVRGREVAVAVVEFYAGITPARAGKSLGHSCGTMRRRDHPRACGEESLMTRINSGHRGSPPRVRGRGEGV